MAIKEREIPHKYRNKYLQNTNSGVINTTTTGGSVGGSVNVLDTLESDSPSAALSANQGRILKELFSKYFKEDSDGNLVVKVPIICKGDITAYGETDDD